MATIYCLMITGRTKSRIEWAKLAVNNFREQTYPYKKLIIINENADGYMVTNGKEPHISEYQVSREVHPTLGDFRNYSLSLVPSGAYIYIFDDDDYRSPELLEYFMSNVKDGDTMVQIKSRINYNTLTRASWISHNKRGLHHFFASIDKLRKVGFQYLKRNEREDENVHSYSNRHLLENEPRLYCRFTHNENTSVYVNKKQKEALATTMGNYMEFPMDDSSRFYLETHVLPKMRHVRQNNQWLVFSILAGLVISYVMMNARR